MFNDLDERRIVEPREHVVAAAFLEEENFEHFVVLVVNVLVRLGHPWLHHGADPRDEFGTFVLEICHVLDHVFEDGQR